jgi:hypothetical protein
LCLLIPILTACGDDDIGAPPPRAPHLLRLQPENDVKVAKAASAAPGLEKDPLDAGGDRLIQHDALDSGGDALTKDSDSPSSQDPLSSVGTTNWYWMRGSISGGTITVEVNGITLGQYSVHMDKEITRMLHPGGNSITFTPQRDNPQTPVQAHLEVVYSQMSPGQLPPLVYDTRQITQPDVTALANPPASVYKRPVDKTEDPGAAHIKDSSSTNPPANLAPAALQDTPTTLTLFAK